MAYSRFFDSDIYIYPHVGGHIECSACLLNQVDDGSVFPKSEYIYDDPHLWEHIEEHVKAGHDIPRFLIQEILEDENRYGRADQ